MDQQFGAVCKKGICKTILITTCANLIIGEDNHTCEPDTVSNEFSLRLDNNMKKNISEVTVPVSSIYRETVGNMKDNGMDLIKKYQNSTLSKTNYRKRNELGVVKTRFKTLRETVIPEKLHSFLLADYRTTNRIMIFANQSCRALLVNTSYDVLCDGTLKFCLHPFNQLYSLHVDL